MNRYLIVCGGVLSLLGLALPSTAQVQRPIPSADIPIPVDLYPGYGVTLNFRPTGETVHRVWLDDPSQVTLDFDDPDCARLGDPGSCAATVVHLRRINPLDFPDLPTSTSTLLTVLTAQQIYQFRLAFPQAGQPSYTTLELQPPTPAVPVPSVTLADLYGQSGAAVVERGLGVAQMRSQIAPTDPLWARIQTFLTLLRQGIPTAEAATQAGISTALVIRLAELGAVIN